MGYEHPIPFSEVPLLTCFTGACCPCAFLQEEVAYIMEDANIMPSVLQVEVRGVGSWTL